jgi:hypothetical protein
VKRETIERFELKKRATLLIFFVSSGSKRLNKLTETLANAASRSIGGSGKMHFGEY